MKIARRLLCIALLSPGAVAFAQSGAAGPIENCPNKSVEHVDGTFRVVGPAACENGFLEFSWGGISISWEDPVCPLMMVWTPPYDNIIDGSGTTISSPQAAQAMAFFFNCKDDNCLLMDQVSLSGDYLTYTVEPCQGGDPR